MKFAVIGTHSTGKTELCNSLYEILSKKYDVRIVSESARKCPFPINKNTSLEGQIWILFEHIAEEVKNKSDIIICDRSVIDNYIYLLRKFPDFANSIKKFILEYSKSYDIIFKTEIEKEIISDGFREVDEEFRKEIDHLLKQFLDENKIKYHTLPSENKVEFIIKKIEEII